MNTKINWSIFRVPLVIFYLWLHEVVLDVHVSIPGFKHGSPPRQADAVSTSAHSYVWRHTGSDDATLNVGSFNTRLAQLIRIWTIEVTYFNICYCFCHIHCYISYALCQPYWSSVNQKGSWNDENLYGSLKCSNHKTLWLLFIWKCGQLTHRNKPQNSGVIPRETFSS